MDNNIAAKKILIAGLSSIPNADESLNNNELILFTPNGMITGKFVNHKKIESSTPSDTIFKELFNVFDKTLSERNIQNQSNSFVLLKDVTITNGSATSNLAYLVVFTDQIIGATIGTINWQFYIQY